MQSNATLLEVLGYNSNTSYKNMQQIKVSGSQDIISSQNPGLGQEFSININDDGAVVDLNSLCITGEYAYSTSVSYKPINALAMFKPQSLQIGPN